MLGVHLAATSDQVNSGLKGATNIVTIDIIFIVISLRNLKIYIFLRGSLSKVVEIPTLKLRLLSIANP
jgi:hypothetical protein